VNTKRTAKVALATLGLSVLLPTGAMAATDTQGHWAGSVLAKWESQALISGYEDGTIRPDNQISRAEFVALVNRVGGYQASGTTVAFSDVKAGDWYAGQVAAAVQQGYIGGFEDNTFRPNDSVTRAQAAAIIARIKGLSSDADRADQFADGANVPQWAKGVVGAVANAGYMIGDEANNFNADKALTRAEAVASLDRVFGVKEAAEQTLTLSSTEGTISKIASKTIDATSSVEGATISAVSSDTGVATVSVSGNKVTIKGVEKGTATITVTAKADGYKVATATYTINVTAAAGGGGGGGSSSSSGSSNTATVVETVATAEDKITVPENVDKTKITIKTVVYENSSVDAKTTIELPENVEVESVTLPKASTFTAGGVEVKLTSEIKKDASDDTDTVITVEDVMKAVDQSSEAYEKLSTLNADRKLISYNATTGNWSIDGMSAAEQADVFAQLEFALTAK
jgi:hypothetical protein